MANFNLLFAVADDENAEKAKTEVLYKEKNKKNTFASLRLSRRIDMFWEFICILRISRLADFLPAKNIRV